MAETKEVKETKDTKPKIEDRDDFLKAISDAQMDGVKFIEVPDAIFNKMKPGSKPTDSFTFGTPGIRVYRTGTKHELDDMEAMRAEDQVTTNYRDQLKAFRAKHA